jgi:hypothetical protein
MRCSHGNHDEDNGDGGDMLLLMRENAIMWQRMTQEGGGGRGRRGLKNQKQKQKHKQQGAPPPIAPTRQCKQHTIHFNRALYKKSDTKSYK